MIDEKEQFVRKEILNALSVIITSGSMFCKCGHVNIHLMED